MFLEAHSPNGYTIKEMINKLSICQMQPVVTDEVHLYVLTWKDVFHKQSWQKYQNKVQSMDPFIYLFILFNPHQRIYLLI